jgi:DegV family protein with EDD domain
VNGGGIVTVKITSDSTCDLSPALLDKYDISIVPLYIIKDGKAYRDGVDITPEDIFRYVEATGDFCTTAAVNVHDYTAFFRRYASQYETVIHVCLGSDFSLCYANAVEAAKSFKNVIVVDSMNLSSGQGHIVLEAARLSRAGIDADSIVGRLKELAGKVETSFLIDRLDYIFKGGRCSLATALGANILHLRTCVEVISGKMLVTKKYKGSFERSVDAYVRDKLVWRHDLRLDTIFITHPAAPEGAVRAARAAIAQSADFREIVETKAGCTVSCHCGPKTLGVLFVRR